MVSNRFLRLLKVKFQAAKILGPIVADFLKQLNIVMQKRGWNYFPPRNRKSRDLLGHVIVLCGDRYQQTISELSMQYTSDTNIMSEKTVTK